MSNPVKDLVSTTLARGVQLGARLDQLTFDLHELYRTELEITARTGEKPSEQDAARRTLRALSYRSIAELTFASVASWTVWATTQDGATVKDDWSRHRPVIAKYLDRHGSRLPTDVVFVALNWGVKAGLPTDDWANFHTGSRDYFLADAIRGHVGERGIAVTQPPLPRFKGVYITDFFKGLPTSDGGALRRIAGNDLDELVSLSGDLLARELALLGATPETVLVPLGTGARDVLTRFCEDREFATPRNSAGEPLVVDHYAYVQPHQRYYEQLAQVHACLPNSRS